MNKITNTIKHCFRLFGHIMSYTFIDKLHNVILSLWNIMYTGYIERRFAAFGKNSFFYWHAYTLAGTKYIHIGNNNTFEKGLQLTARKTDDKEPIIKIGNNCLFRACAHITAINSIEIGNNLLTGTNILITDNLHGNTSHTSLCVPPRERPLYTKGKVKIGDNVWLGNNVCVMPGVTIGDNVVIGANSIVTHDIPAYCIAAGIPARIIKKN